MNGPVRSGNTESFVRTAAAWVCFFVFAYAGFSKLQDPKPTGEFLKAIYAVSDARVVTAIGVTELVIALALAHTRTRRAALAVSMCLFAAFATTHVFRAVDGAAAKPCGCLGAGGITDTWPPTAWIALNTALSLLACLGASSWRRSRAARDPARPPTITPPQESFP